MRSAETTTVVEAAARPVLITVNRQDVKIAGPTASGLDIKRAAIDQGIAIELDFQLAMVGRGGAQGIVGDRDTVEIHDGSEFFATASDDNS